MRSVALVVVVLVILSFLVFVGCGGGYEGKYVNVANASEYLELKSGGNFFLQERGFAFSGKWKVSGENIIFILPTGMSDSLKIENGRLVERNGKTWIKK